jgi:predicted nuclease of predicted toxin-antitoxin system
MTGTPIKLLLDEHIWTGLTEALKKRGYEALHVLDTDQSGLDDEPLLAFAASQGRAVLTYNVKHFAPLVSLWYEAGREHAGIIFSVQLPPSELLRQTLKLLETLSADGLKNTARWLQEFKGD